MKADSLRNRKTEVLSVATGQASARTTPGRVVLEKHRGVEKTNFLEHSARNSTSGNYSKKTETSALLSPLPSSREEGTLVAGERRRRHPRRAPPPWSNLRLPTALARASVDPLAVVTLPWCAAGMVSLWDSLKEPVRGKVFWKSKWLLFFSMKDEQISSLKGQFGPCEDQAIVTSAASLSNFSPEEGAARPVRRECSF